jgi:hypothetical protein
MAFNRSGTLFFNARWFERLEHEKDDKQALVFWFTTFCHELAHNVASGHDKKHEAAEEALLTHHMATFSQMLGMPYMDISVV